MENKFYIGTVIHKKRIRRIEEKIVLYTKDDIQYIDLINNRIYFANYLAKDYVVRESLIPTDPSEHRIDYKYLLSRFESNGITRKKKLNFR